MGHGMSKAPLFGVPANPRVGYAHDNSKQQQKPVLIDAPILVKLQNGTVRYRYLEKEDAPAGGKGRTERPHEGSERRNKHGYFFHTKLNDYSEDASYDKEESWKFSYVYKGADKSCQKTLYYVFGKGLKKDHSEFSDESQSRPQGKGYEWPSVYKQHGHLYFDITFLPQDGEIEESDTEDGDLDDASPDAPLHPFEISLKEADSLSGFKRRLAIRFIKPQGIIHLFHKGLELTQQNLKIGSLRELSDGAWSRFRVRLLPK